MNALLNFIKIIAFCQHYSQMTKLKNITFERNHSKISLHFLIYIFYLIYMKFWVKNRSVFTMSAICIFHNEKKCGSCLDVTKTRVNIDNFIYLSECFKTHRKAKLFSTKWQNLHYTSFMSTSEMWFDLIHMFYSCQNEIFV